MSMEVENRVSTLEQVLERFIENTEKSISTLTEERRKDRAENKASLEKYKEENKAEFKKFTQKMNKEWGDLANKMGTLIEDIIMPGIPSTLKKYFNTQLNFSGTHVNKYLKKLDLKGEFDIVATDEDRVYVADVKSSPDKKKIDDFKNKVIPRFRKLFPEYDSKTLIPIMGSLRFDKDIISYASKEGIYVMGYREWEYLDILNFDEVKLK